METKRKMAKSPVALAKVALQTAKSSLEAYPHPFSPKRFTQHQLFAILALRQFLKTVYRGIIQMLKDFSDLRKVLELMEIPHYSTFLLCRKKAAKKRGFEKLLAAIFEQSWAIGILDKAQEGAIDSTGIDTHHLSYHFVNCTKRPSYFRRTWPKITIVCDTATHLIASCIVTRGPSYGFGLFEQAVGKAYKQVRFKRMLADGGYDSETNHRIAREIFGMETMIKLNLRGFNIEPKGEHRIETKEKFNKKIYNNRRQIESVFSRNKRLLGSALRNRTEISRERECLLRVLTHNLMIIRRAA